MISQALQQAQTFQQVVDMINAANNDESIPYHGGVDCANTGDELAGQYAYDAADEAGYGIDEHNLEAHLELLSEAGAKFDHSKAMAEAMRIKKS
ncbi:hypothetical protein [Piscirickettsia litoralis]|uniref:Uncharacterized protein n=1 Tax=Piscirickettsia litoralis TaxID=1891921 RepID=A0ABX3A4R7_9GAMM|nr:hypothetical protein [Piscirickettsia litoralis]ODN41114.1 hypothetical protein BGC07_17725 [Piscirickettsia litoralis]